MTEEEMQAQIDKLTKAQEAMAAKNDELLSEVKAERAKRREAEAAAEQAARDAEEKATEAAEKAGDVETLRKQLEAKHAKDIEKLTRERDDAAGQLNKLVIDGGIDSALDAAGMAPAFKKMLRLSFAADHQIEIKDGQAFVGGDALAEVVKKWTESDEISGLKAAGQANGSGAPGGGKQISKSLSDMGDAERLALAREGKLKAAQGQ
ncbi:hypothetical protein [Paracoccus homiensis]|uniref:Phage minor structural protein GP20 n=1 Tax=Paracoccus homiensis TaxID=364199 RepID=A0A1I0J256_9RHOB|nr:hypothetical protein [Paracoccus homiensis]SEU03111.1 hypothetical protein SAMN04489858_12054 [Paracoccus homiensis]